MASENLNINFAWLQLYTARGGFNNNEKHFTSTMPPISPKPKTYLKKDNFGKIFKVNL